MRILFLTDNFPPESNAPASRTYEHAKVWVSAGHQVTVVTCAPNFPEGKVFPGYRNTWRTREYLNGIEVVRVWTYVSANQGVLKRTLDYLSFMVTGALAGILLPRKDVVIATSPQFFCACAGWIVGAAKRIPFVFELRDLWPDSIVTVGAMRESIAIRLLRRTEYFLYRRADLIVTVTHSFRRILSANGIAAGKIVVVPNGADHGEYQPGPRPEELAAKIGVAGKFVAAYLGTIGMAHGLGTLLAAAEELRHRQDIVFLLVGAGAERGALEREAGQRGLRNVVFVGAVPKSDIVRYWHLADVALILLRDTPLFRNVIPSKMFEAMATGCPIVLGVDGESREILDQARAGIAIPPGDGHDLALAVEKFADQPVMAAQMAISGRHFVVQHFDRVVLAMRMLDAIENAIRLK